jgi:hypothetical protein
MRRLLRSSAVIWMMVVPSPPEAEIGPSPMKSAFPVADFEVGIVNVAPAAEEADEQAPAPRRRGGIPIRRCRRRGARVEAQADEVAAAAAEAAPREKKLSRWTQEEDAMPGRARAVTSPRSCT